MQKGAHHQAKKIAKHRNRLGDDPSDNPERQSDPDPGSHSRKIPLVYAIGASKDTGVDGFAGDVAADDAGDDDLKNRQWTPILYLSRRLS